jgi:hypothetical protein
METFSSSAISKESAMSVIAIGIDLAKSVFQVQASMRPVVSPDVVWLSSALVTGAFR